MGNLYDYFRAADAATVTSLMDASDGGPLIREGQEPPVEVVDAKYIDPDVALGKLVGFILDVDWDVDLMATELVWPDESEVDEQFVVGIGDRARDALAEVQDGQQLELAARWSRIEEFSWFSDVEPDTFAPVLGELVRLARNAKAKDEHLYCWCSL